MIVVYGLLMMWIGQVQAEGGFEAAFAHRDWAAAEQFVASDNSDRKPVWIAALKTMQGEFDEAQQFYEQARVHFQTDAVMDGRLAVAQGIVAFLDGRRYGDGAPTEALVHLARAKDLLGADDVRLKLVEAEILGHSSQAVHAQQAYIGYMGLIAHFEKAGDSLLVAHSAMRLGRIDGTTGGHGGALVNFERAAHIFESLGNVRMHAWALRNIGHAHRKMGHYDQSQVALEKALEEARVSNNPALEMRVLNDLSRLFMEIGQRDVAKKYEQQADDVLALMQGQMVAGGRKDSVMLDFYQLVKLRYASLLPYETDLYTGFYDQLLVEK